MHAVYEYVFTTLIFILIFTASIASLLNIIETPMRHIKQQQLYSTAETVLDALLGTPGDPKDWGSNVTLRAEDLRVVGLSKGLKTDIIYDLDPDKLSRLLPMGSEAYIDESTLKSLLNLGMEYGFSLTLNPVLNLSVTPIEEAKDQRGKKYASSFNVTVTTHEKVPVGNVNLTAYLVTSYDDVPNKKVYYVTNETRRGITFWNGTYNFNYTTFITELLSKGGENIKLVGTVLVVMGDFFGMKTMTVYHCCYGEAQILQGISIGKYVFIEERLDGPVVQLPVGNNSAEFTFNYVVETKLLNATLHGNCPWLIDYNNRHFKCLELSYLEPDIYCIAFVARTTGYGGVQGLSLVIVPRVPLPGFRIGSTSVPMGNRVVAIRRVAFVNDMAFFADFYFWRNYDVEV